MPNTRKIRQRLRNLFRRNRARTRPTTYVTAEAKEEEDTAAGDQEADDSEKKNVDVEIIPPPPLEGEMPTYFHVGGWAKECLLHGFKLGAWQIFCNSTTTNGYHLTSFGEAYPTANNVFGGVEAYKEVGDLHVSLGWFTNNEFLTELGLRGSGGHWYGHLKTAMGTKDEVTLHSNIKCGLEVNPIKLELIVPIHKEPLFQAYAVFAPIENWLLGYRTVYSLEEKGFDMHALCLGFSNGKTELGLKLENFKDLRGSVFQRFGENWAFALKANLYSSENVKQLSVGGQYDFLNGTLLKARVREDSRFGFVYQTKVGPNIDVMYHLGFDLADPIKGAHRIGASMAFHC